MELKNSDSRYYFDLIKNVLRLPTSTISALGHMAHISIIAQFRCTLPGTEYAALKFLSRNVREHRKYACTITKTFLMLEMDFNVHTSTCIIIYIYIFLSQIFILYKLQCIKENVFHLQYCFEQNHI